MCSTKECFGLLGFLSCCGRLCSISSIWNCHCSIWKLRSEHEWKSYSPTLFFTNALRIHKQTESLYKIIFIIIGPSLLFVDCSCRFSLAVMMWGRGQESVDTDGQLLESYRIPSSWAKIHFESCYVKYRVFMLLAYWFGGFSLFCRSGHFGFEKEDLRAEESFIWHHKARRFIELYDDFWFWEHIDVKAKSKRTGLGSIRKLRFRGVWVSLFLVLPYW